MVKYYSINGKLTKLGIKEHNQYELERIAEYERAIEMLDECAITQNDRALMIKVLEGYISRSKEKLL